MGLSEPHHLSRKFDGLIMLTRFFPFLIEFFSPISSAYILLVEN